LIDSVVQIRHITANEGHHRGEQFECDQQRRKIAHPAAVLKGGSHLYDNGM